MASNTMRNEADMYAPIEALFESQGYSVLREGKEKDKKAFFVSSINRRVDVLAFKWEGDGIRTIAVEAKTGSALSALDEGLAQACDYQKLFDEVYIAGEGRAGRNRKAFASKNLGYISVNTQRRDALIEISAER